MKTIRILNPVPSFVCPYRRIDCGPFEKGEVVELPDGVADLLVRKRRAREVVIENPFQQWESLGGGKND